MNIKFRKEGLALQAVDDVGDKGKRVIVAYGPLV